MSYCILFGLLFCFLACHREGVWNKYTPQQVARWQGQPTSLIHPVVREPAQPSQAPAPGEVVFNPSADQFKRVAVVEEEECALVS